MRRNTWLWWGLTLVAAGVLALGAAGPASGRWRWGPPGVGPGGTEGTGYDPGMMGGGMMGGTYGMGGWRGQAPAPGQKPISPEDARAAVERLLARVDRGRFAVAELWSFTDGPYYAAIEDRDRGRGAFELLIDRYSAAVHPEPGPNIMWNLKYGMMGGHMTGSVVGPGMKSGRFGTGPAQAGEDPRIAREAAAERAQAYLDRQRPGAKVRAGGHEFYGYWTLHFEQDGKLAGMLSVNAATGAVWLHTWHATPAAVVEGKHD